MGERVPALSYHARQQIRKRIGIADRMAQDRFIAWQWRNTWGRIKGNRPHRGKGHTYRCPDCVIIVNLDENLVVTVFEEVMLHAKREAGGDG